MRFTFDNIKNKKAVLFDLDGTLIDSMWMWKAIDIEFLARFGLECPKHLQDEIEGMSLAETAVYFAEHFHIPMSLEDMQACWNEMAYEKYKNEVPLKKGALRFLEELKKQQIKIGIATSNSTILASTVLNSLGVSDLIDVMITGSDVAHGKPDPEIYLTAAKKLGVQSKDCFVFEDILVGIEAGHRAGMPVCAVADDYSRQYLNQKIEKADAFIEDYDELFEGMI